LCENGIPAEKTRLPEFGGTWRGVAASYATSAQSLKEKDWQRLLGRCGYQITAPAIKSEAGTASSSRSRTLDDAHHKLYIPSSPPPQGEQAKADSADSSASSASEDDSSSEDSENVSSSDSDESASESQPDEQSDVEQDSDFGKSEEAGSIKIDE
jgi:hypothetical protein